MTNRFPSFSGGMPGFSGPSPNPMPATATPRVGQISTTTILNALHSIYTAGIPYALDPTTSIVVNTWLTVAAGHGSGDDAGSAGTGGGSVDGELARRAWEHARRRAEDGCILLCSTHDSSPSLFTHFLQTIPLPTPEIVYTALSAIKPFLFHVTPQNPSKAAYSAFSAYYTFTLSGRIAECKLSLSTSGIDTQSALLRIPSESGYRAFDVFYYLLTSASTPAEREFLGLNTAQTYSLLNRSGTFTPPEYLPTADDAAAAEDFRAALREIGIKGAAQRSLIAILAALLKLGNATSFLVDQEDLEDICEDVGGLLNVDPEVILKKCGTDDREVLIAGIYEAVVDWVIIKANTAIAAALARQNNSSDNGSGNGPASFDDLDTVGLTIMDVPDPTLGRALALRSVFDDSKGINEEMKEDGVDVPPTPSSVLRDMQAALTAAEPYLAVPGTPAMQRLEQERDKTEGVVEKVGVELETSAFLHGVLYPYGAESGINVCKFNHFDLNHVVESSRVWFHLCVHPSDDPPATLAALPTVTSSWSAGVVSRQLRQWRLQEWANRRGKHLDYTADFDVEEFTTRYRPLGCQDGRDGIEIWTLQRGWSNGEVVVGQERVWMRESAWSDVEAQLDLKPEDRTFTMHGNNASGSGLVDPFMTPHASGILDPGNYYATPLGEPGTSIIDNGQGLFPPPQPEAMSLLGESRDNLLGPPQPMHSAAPSISRTTARAGPIGDYGLGVKGDEKRYDDADIAHFMGELDPEIGTPKTIEKKDVPRSRQLWVAFVWAVTFWIPSPILRFIGRMKRPDVRLAWREKFVLFLLIIFANAMVIFYIVGLDYILCPNRRKVWSVQEVGQRNHENKYWVAIHGKVYDITDWWRVQHSDIPGRSTTADVMMPLAGLDLTQYFMPPWSLACPGLVGANEFPQIQNNLTRVPNDHQEADHTSGARGNPRSKLHDDHWYTKYYQPKIKEFFKGDIVIKKKDIKNDAENNNGYQFIIDRKVYDMTSYFYTNQRNSFLGPTAFIPDSVTSLLKENPGKDITHLWQDGADWKNTLNCMDNAFYAGKVDFRDEPKCTVLNYILLSFAILICIVIVAKFLAALQLGSKRRPAMQDKFVICQVPAYTEGEDQIRKGLDSLTALQYDNKRKLIWVICDGMIVGGGNDRPTPKIVLDILGVDPKIDPPALPFQSIGVGSEQLNYGKVYSGLYEYEGNVVPYVVTVKVGKESEQGKSKPGNRGKRDSQMLVMQFLNRVHFRAPMSPLELETFHQINNIIGVDPELYEYLLMVDADTSVKEDSLNRLVAACANDSKIVGICGETSLDNEGKSWWTMIQVYEYYISHHLAKAFESLFGSVTCLPGCFCMYRLRTADKGKPLIISDEIIKEYSDCEVDTLHKKNLLSLGEDRFLTTIMLKHFPKAHFKFVPNALALTAAPEQWSVLLSQRRRWINSTIHNLFELVWIDDLCGFCMFSMRFVVFVDLVGTIILPATVIYLVYLIVICSTTDSAIPYISIAMIAGVYGLQAVIFLLKRQWQHIGWMIIYLMAYPVYSFILPLYSFWNQDNFSWGNTRVVIGEKGDKKIVAMDDEGFDPRSIPLQRWDDYAMMNGLPGRRTGEEKFMQPYTDDAMVEMDDMRSMYSSIKPASTILTGFPAQGLQHGPYATPPSPYSAALGGNNRMSSMPRYTDQPGQSHLSVPGAPYYDEGRLSPRGALDNRQSRMSTGLASRPMSSFDLRASRIQGPDDGAIIEAIQACLADVDLDTVTKKQVRALVEQRLQTSLTGERRAFLDKQIDVELARMESYTTSTAFFEALYEYGVRYCFVNLGSDHPSILEAIAQLKSEGSNRLPTMVTCPNEMVAMSMADGYARLTGKPQCVIVHVDVGTQGLGAAVHNASCGRAPVLVFAGLSPFTLEGETRGSRTEYIHWIQDVPDQKAIVSQYCRYTNEIKVGQNVKQIVFRALQYAQTAPAGPVYLTGGREIMEQEIKRIHPDPKKWKPVGLGILPEDAVELIGTALAQAKKPLVITGYCGRNANGVAELVRLADTVKGLMVLDTGGSDMCFPANHPSSLGLRYGVHEAIEQADIILVADCDVPWINTLNSPKNAKAIYHIDGDPLKQQMPLFYLEAQETYKVDSAAAFKQLHEFIAKSPECVKALEAADERAKAVAADHQKRLADAAALAVQPKEPTADLEPDFAMAHLRTLVPEDTIYAIEAVTLTGVVADQIQPHLPKSWINCGGGGLGWSGGGALGIKLATDDEAGGSNKGKFVCQIVADGTFLFSVPASVYWIARRYNIPVLTIVLNNRGWNAPRRSMMLVHPEGYASKATREDLNISFTPTPDYAGIAKAAAGGKLWAGRAATVEEYLKALPQAVESVKAGQPAVLELQFGGREGAYQGE